MDGSMQWPQKLQHAGFALFFILFVSTYLSLWLDLKVGADLQARVGPNRAGRAGFWQPLADGLRLLFRAHHVVDLGRSGGLWWLQTLPIFAMIAVVPAGSDGPLLESPLAIFTPVLLGLCFAWTGLLLGWQREKIENRLFSIRQSALSLSAALPAFLSVAIAGITVGGFEWERIHGYQGFSPTQWVAFSNPFAFIAAIGFLASGMLIFSLPPFSARVGTIPSINRDLDDAAGIPETWIRLSHRLAPICWSLVAVEIFFGGCSVPSAVQSLLQGSWSLEVIQSAILILKVVGIQVVLSIAARTLPAVRLDQAHDFAWRVLSPASILALIGIRLLAFGWSGGGS